MDSNTKNLKDLILTNSKDVKSEYLEMSLDFFMKEGILKDIPVVGTISSLFKVGIGFRDAIFFKKLTYFLHYMNNISKDDIEKFNQKAFKDDNDCAEKLIYIIDKIDENKKAEYLAKLYKGYCNSILSYHEFRKCCIALTNIYINDLEHLKQHSINDTEIGYIFISFGLYEIRDTRSGYSKSKWKVDERETFNRTSLGRKMNDCIFDE